jgi:hypothetical protein
MALTLMARSSASWTGAEGDTIPSYTLLAVNDNHHALLRRYQQRGAEKRMPLADAGSGDQQPQAQPVHRPETR